MAINSQKFALGQIVATPGAMAALQENHESPEPYLARHANGQWGDELCEEDRERNEQALREGARLLSAYRTHGGTTLWIITEADRSSTCILLPEEY